MLGTVSSLYALPSNPDVISGSVSFDQPDAQTLNVNSSSSRAIVNWEDFSLAVNETVYFNLPSSDSAIFNRVTSTEISNVLSSIESNGQVFLINPNGIIVGPDSVINTSAFLASTLDGDNQEFLNASDMTFTGGTNSDVYLVNYGTVTASEGDSILLGYQVANSGTITAENGTYAAGAGVEIILQPNSTDNRILIVPNMAIGQVPIGVEDGSYVSALRAELAADGNSYELAIKHDNAWIDARGLSGNDSIVIFTSYDGKTFANSTITALDDDDTGGTIAILGTEVELGNSCLLYASGQNGGGEIYIGGGWQGNDPDLMNATNTLFAGSAQAEVDATLSGNGGTAVVWADNKTEFFGTILCRGGTIDGDGGMVEVSGVNDLDFGGTVDVTARGTGSDGILVLDPENLNYHPKAPAPGLVPATPQIKSKE
jgi:filamentous hemagglutinin family protein